MRKEDINLTGLDLYLFTTIDVTRKRKGSIIQYVQIYFYFRCPFLLLPLLGILGESKAE